jgi:hypothetical protein
MNPPSTEQEKKLIASGFSHPCKGTCSGYQQARKELLKEICEWLESDEAKALKHCHETIQKLFGQTGSLFAKELKKKFGTHENTF